MKNFKRVSAVTILLAMVLVFTGCTNGELKLYNAFLKSQDIRTMESELEMSFKLEGEGLSEETAEMLKEVSSVLNGLKITMNQKMEKDEEGTKSKVQVDSEIDMGGVKTDLSIWLDVDMSEDAQDMKYTIKMPQMVMAMLGEEFADKEYIVYDYKDILETSGMDLDNKELMEWAKEMEPVIMNFLEEHVKNFDSDVKMIESKGLRAINKEAFDIYELRLSDESFKTLIRNTTNGFMENEDMKKFIEEYMDMVFKFVESQNDENTEEMKKEIEELKIGLDKELPNMKENFNKFMDEFDKVAVLGEEGIVVEYAINQEGYIVSEKATINLMLDLKTLEMEGMEGIIKLRIDSNSRNFNINGDVKIEMPELNKEKTLNLGDLIDM